MITQTQCTFAEPKLEHKIQTWETPKLENFIYGDFNKKLKVCLDTKQKNWKWIGWNSNLINIQSEIQFNVKYLGIKRWIDPIREGLGMRESVWIRIRIRIVESSIAWAIDPELLLLLLIAIVVNFERDLAHFFFEICIRSPHRKFVSQTLLIFLD